MDTGGAINTWAAAKVRTLFRMAAANVYADLLLLISERKP